MCSSGNSKVYQNQAFYKLSVEHILQNLTPVEVTTYTVSHFGKDI